MLLIYYYILRLRVFAFYFNSRNCFSKKFNKKVEKYFYKMNIESKLYL